MTHDSIFRLEFKDEFKGSEFKGSVTYASHSHLDNQVIMRRFKK